MLITFGAPVLRTNRLEQSKGVYSIEKVFSIVNGFIETILEVHRIQRVFEYPDIWLFIAYISHGSNEFVTLTSVPVKVPVHVQESA